MPGRLLFLLLSVVMSQPAAAADRDYAESVAMTGHAEDAQTTFDVRIARFPGRNTGTLWMYAFVDGRQFSLVDETVQLVDADPTDVTNADAQFAVRGSSTATLAGTARHTSSMQGRLAASGMMHATAHPLPGSGSIPVRIDAIFSAEHTPISVRPGRIEVMGQVRGSITIDGQVFPLDLPGKWHEQTGARPEFAPAFTYFFVQGRNSGIMTTRHAGGAWGYLYQLGTIRPVIAMDITPYGSPERAFTITLEDGATVSGIIKVIREVSVPIEGKRRPGATVLVDSDIGPLVGVLNDWDPQQ